jgi:hypothetical protein
VAATVRAVTSSERVDAEQRVAEELEAWRAQAMPDRTAPLDADDLARLVRSCLDTLGLDGDVGSGFSVNTVHYYRRKDILDAPAGRTSAARYDMRHVWQAIGARLAGSLGLVTLAEARDVMRGATEAELVAFAAARVLDARGRQRLRQAAVAPRAAVRALVRDAAPEMQARPLPGVFADQAEPSQRVVIPLPGDAWCIVPASHSAHRSATSAQALVQALAAALGVEIR